MTMTVPAVAAKPKKYTVRDRDGQVVGKAELRRIPVAVIKVDSAYQRDVSSSWVNEHRPFDSQKASVVVLSGRAGGPYVIDGQHRLALARESGVEFINAFVVEGLAQMDEARLFVGYQRERRNLTAYALFRAELVAGNPETLAMVRIVNNAGFRIAQKGGPLTVTAIDAVRYVHRYGGDDLLARTLELVRSIWMDLEKALSAQVLKGLALFLASAGQQPTFRRERLERVMEKNAPVRVLLLSQQVATKRRAFSVNSAANVAEAIKDEYDKLTPKDEEKLGPLTIGTKKRPAAKGSSR